MEWSITTPSNAVSQITPDYYSNASTLPLIDPPILLKRQSAFVIPQRSCPSFIVAGDYDGGQEEDNSGGGGGQEEDHGGHCWRTCFGLLFIILRSFFRSGFGDADGGIGSNQKNDESVGVVFEDLAQLVVRIVQSSFMLRGMYMCMVELLGVKLWVVVRFCRMLMGEKGCIFFNSSSWHIVVLPPK